MKDFPYKICNSKVKTDSIVYYNVYDEKGTNLWGQIKQGCFAGITYATLPKEIKLIRVFFETKNIPYSLEIQAAWIKEITELGFPCKFSHNKTTSFFEISLKDYKKKKHLNCTLQLIRCLFEIKICHVPEIYFTLVKEKGGTISLDEKFMLLQQAHFELDDYEESIQFNWNHTITSRNNNPSRSPVSKKIFFNRIDRDNYLLYDTHTYENPLYKFWFPN